MLPLVKIGSIAAFVAIAAVGLTIVIVYVAAPISFKDVCEDVTPPSTFSLVPISDSMFLTWGRGTASSNCEINYELLVYNNDEHIYNITLFSNQYLYPMADKPSCSIYAFELITISNGQYRTESLKRSYETDLETVSNLNVEKDLVSWSINNINTNCVFQLDINRVTVANNLSSLSYNIDELSFCESHVITVTPINFNGTIGTPSTLYFERDISYPRDITMEQESENNTILIAWNHTRYESCEVSYLLNGETYEVSELTPGRQNIDISALKYCSRHVLGVIFSSLSNEVEDSINFTKRLVFPSDLKHNTDSNLEEVILSWNHTLYKSCLVEINLDNNSVSIEDPFTGSQSIPISELEFCRIHVLEMVFIDESNGAGVSAEESFDIARGVVFPSDLKHNIDSNLEEVILSWNHTLYKSCLVEINLDNNSVSIEDPFTGSQSIPISELEFCRIHVLEMVFLDESNGAAVGAEESFDIARGIVFPSDLEYDIDTNLEVVVLSWNHTLYKSCLVEINLDSNSVSVDDPFTGSQSIPISELEFCSIYVLEVVFIDESNGIDSQKQDYNFTRPGIFPDNLDLTVTSTTAQFVWDNTGLEDCIYNITSENFAINTDSPVIEGLNGECDIYDVNIILKDQLGKITDEKSFKFLPFQSIKDLTGVLTQTPLDNDKTSNIVEISMTVKDCKLLSDVAYNCTTYNSPITTSRSHLFDNCLIDISDNFWMSIKPILFDSGDEDIKVNEVKCSYEWNNASGSLDVILEESDEDICPPTIKKSDLTDE